MNTIIMRLIYKPSRVHGFFFKEEEEENGTVRIAFF